MTATVREFAAKEILPVAAELDHNPRYPAEIIASAAALGLLGLTVPEEYGGAGLDGRAGHRHRAEPPGLRSDPALRHRRAEAPLSAAAGRWRVAGVLLSDRTGRGQRRHVAADAGGTARRGGGPHRGEELRHQRARRA